jgi:hypothetical protein
VFGSFPDNLKYTLLFAHFHNSAGVAHFELNELDKARAHFLITKEIRESHINPEEPETEELFALILQNIGMLESAAGNLDEAIALLTKGQRIRDGLRIPPERKRLQNLHTQLGRALILKGMMEEGRQQYQLGDEITVEKFGKKTLVYAR